MGKSSKKKKSGSAKSNKAPNDSLEPLKPYLSPDGIRFSGLETEGMKQIRSSLMIPEDRVVRPSVQNLKPQTVTLYRDLHFHFLNDSVHFPGASVMHVEVAGNKEGTMPMLLTVAGKCLFTKRCQKEFDIIMRTNEESKRQGIQPNSVAALDWPDRRCLQLCPVCGNMAEPDDGTVFWMIFYPMLQAPSPNDIQVRTIQRLTCTACFESLLQEIVCIQEYGEAKPIMRMLDEDIPSVAFLDGRNNPIIGGNVRFDAPLAAIDLLWLWDDSGAWQANEDIAESRLQEAMRLQGAAGGRSARVPGENGGQDRMMVDIRHIKSWKKEKEGSATQTASQANKSMGKDSEVSKTNGEKSCNTCSLDLSEDDFMRCSRCKVATYCSRECQKKDWSRHKLHCTAPSS